MFIFLHHFHNLSSFYYTGATYTRAETDAKVLSGATYSLQSAVTYADVQVASAITYTLNSAVTYTDSKIASAVTYTLLSATTYTNDRVLSGVTYSIESAVTHTESYVSANYYDKSTADSTFSSKGGSYSFYDKTTQLYTTNNQYIIGDSYNGTGRTVTLADADIASGKVFIIHDKRGNANLNNITIQPESDGFPVKINGGSSVSITTAFGAKIVYSDGSNWYSN